LPKFRCPPYPGSNILERQQALTILDEYIENENLKRHMLAVEAAMRDYAPDYQGDPDTWGLAGLLHDFDWEIHPNAEQHPMQGAPLLRQRGVPEEIVECILSHAEDGPVPRTTPMQKVLYACDELTGLITAVALVRPSRSLHDLKVKSVKKKWKDARFAAAVNREDIERGVADLGLDLWEHVGRVIQAMRTVAADLDLDGTVE
ncbi:MAG: HDIG domain-containing protein, partial [Anaerolineales bacterium]